MKTIVVREAVVKRSQTITFPDLPTKTTADAAFNPGATASSRLPVTYTSNNPDVAIIVAGQVQIVGAGSANITASQEGSSSYLAAEPVTRTLTVTDVFLE